MLHYTTAMHIPETTTTVMRRLYNLISNLA